jgi:hypothetical protein
MNLKLKKACEETLAPAVSPGTPCDAEPQPRSDTGNVTVTYGIHKGRYPIGGMLVREARTALQKVLSIDESAVAVIAGWPVDEDTRLSDNVTMLSFVKPSAMKGAAAVRERAKATSEKITIEGTEARLADSGGGIHEARIEKFVEGIVEWTVRGLTEEPLPDGVKWLVRCGNLVIAIVQLTPQAHWIKWLSATSPARYGPKAKYQERRLSMPHLIFKVPFLGRHLVPRIEVFYRNDRLRLIDGEGGALCWPNLYNVSVHAYGCTSWFCSQNLPEAQRPLGLEEGLGAVTHHFFGGGFNASSEHHEGESTFGLCARMNIDPRVTDVARWEAETQRDPNFVREVNWKPTGLTVKSLVERELAFHRMAAGAKTARELGNILLRKATAK